MNEKDKIKNKLVKMKFSSKYNLKIINFECIIVLPQNY